MPIEDLYIGLGKVSAETLAIDALYGHRFYNMPQYGKWKLCFAWFPVKTLTWKSYGHSSGVPMKVHEWAWLRVVSKRKVTHRDKFLNRGVSYSMEYVETFDILKFGGVKLSEL